MTTSETIATERSEGGQPAERTDGAAPPVGIGREALAARYVAVRRFTERLSEGLAPEDMVVQSMPDVSPTKWHLAHTSWFFEQFLLLPHLRGYTPLHATYLYLFNSYYQQAGERHCRDQRGYISRPTVAEVLAYRRHVDAALLDLLSSLDDDGLAGLEPLLTLGLHHEQQHQELLLTDIKHVFSVNPLRPVYCGARDGDGESPGARDGRAQGLDARAQDRDTRGEESAGTPALAWVGFEGGVHEVGHDGVGFAFDNEGPRHREYLEPFELANRLVTNGEYLEFMEDGGYRRPELWLALGWAALQGRGWSEPFYWERREGRWLLFTLAGMREVDPDEPVCHLNYFEADAFARWAGARLPTEAEWEVAAAEAPVSGNFADDGRYHPAPVAETARTGLAGITGITGIDVSEPAAVPALEAATRAGAKSGAGLQQLYGDLWEWTASPYTAYPGFRPAAGAVGEYNGKFMCNQFVLRGGSCATSRDHVRPTYRNFFPPDASWQFTGVRLARDR
jgi:ergothioneine biosynthesis protein EgtB